MQAWSGLERCGERVGVWVWVWVCVCVCVGGVAGGGGGERKDIFMKHHVTAVLLDGE